MAAKENVGWLEIQMKLYLYEHVGLNTIFYNMVLWNELRKKDYEKLESIQSKALKKIFGLSPAAPYWGILIETGL